MFIMVEGYSNRCGSKYDSMLRPDLRSYDDNDNGRAFFFFLDDITVASPFPKPPDNDDDNDNLLTASTETGVQKLRI